MWLVGQHVRLTQDIFFHSRHLPTCFPRGTRGTISVVRADGKLVHVKLPLMDEGEEYLATVPIYADALEVDIREKE